MSTKEEKAQRAREKKEKKLLEQMQKDSATKVEEGRLFLEPEGKAAQPNYAKAIAAFDNAIELFPDNALAFALRGVAHRDQGRYEAAIDDFSKAFALDPQNVAAIEGRAACYEALRQVDKAIADYTTILTVHAENDHAYNMRGLCRLRKRAPGLLLKSADFGCVVNDFRNAIRLNENNYYAHANLGKAYEDQRMFKEAIAQYTRALKIKDDYTYAVFRRGCAALALAESLQQKQDAAAAEEGGDASRSAADAVEAVILREQAEERARAEIKSALEGAQRDFDTVINPEEMTSPDQLTAIVHRGTCHLLLGNLTKAEADLKAAEKALNEAANNPDGAALALPSTVLLHQALKCKMQKLLEVREQSAQKN